MPSHLAACALLVSTLALLLLAGAAAASNGDTASSTVTVPETSDNNSSVAAPAGNSNTEMYICYLCAGRNPMLIRWCPIYWDQCHLVCDDDRSAAATTTVPDAAGSRLHGGAMHRNGDDGECYVMKWYEDGRYVIVTRLECDRVVLCNLSCGGGDSLGGAGNATLPGAAPVPTAASQQRPRVADFQRCGSQASMAGALGADHRGE